MFAIAHGLRNQSGKSGSKIHVPGPSLECPRKAGHDGVNVYSFELDVIADAEHFAQLGSSAVNPIHLLYASLLAEDKHRDATLADLNIEKKRLLNVAKREVLMPQLGSASGSKKERSRWN
jgi:hypothetical protein